MSSTIKLRCLDNSGNSIFLVDSESGVYSTNTTESTNSSTGAVLLYGGLSINSTANAIGSTSGGALTIAGGASVGRDLYVGLGITTSTLLATTSISSGNLYATNITISNLISTYISSGSIAATTFTGGDLKLSGDIIIGGTLTTVNITTTNVVDTNISTTNLAVTNINNTTMTSGTILANTISCGSLSLSGDINSYIITTTLGNVGINTTNPAYKLDINGDANIATGLRIGDDLHVERDLYVQGSINGAAASSSTFAYMTLTATDESINLSTGALLTFGGVTIQCTTDSTDLNNGGSLITLGGVSIGKRLLVGTGITTSTLLATNSISSGTINATNSTITNAVNTAVSTGSLNVINTTSTNSSVGTINVSGITTGNINFTGTLYQNGVVYVGSQWTGSIGSTLTYTSGNVGIGKISPDTALDVLGQINVTNNSYGSPIASILGGDGTRVVLSSGSVSTTPVAIGIEDNNMWFSNKDGGYKWYSNTSASMQLTGGNMIVTGDITSFGSISDRRLKTNIETIDDEIALNIVTSLRSVTFDWKDDIANVDKRGLSDVGFIAQEVEELIPYAVSEFVDINSGVSYKNMKHERIIPYLVSAIRHLEKRIRDMESKNVL